MAFRLNSTTKRSFASSKKFVDQEFNCNGSCQTEKQLFILSGDQRQNVKKFFIEEGISNERYIKIHGV